MEITAGEAADALNVVWQAVVRWYTGDPKFLGRPYFGLDSEALCEAINLDHRFLMAFLVGYDVSLSMRQVTALFGYSHDWVKKHVRPTAPPVLVVKAKGCLGETRLVRYSYRRIVPCLAAALEERNGNHRAYAHGGGSVMPPPDFMPPDSWTFRSKIITEGTRLPRARSTRLADGSSSALPILDRSDGEEG